MAGLPGVQRLPQKMPLISVPGIGDEFVPVIYVGTPGSQQKAIVTLVDGFSCLPRAVLKIALGDGAVSSIFREAQVLKYLAEKGVGAVPELLWHDEKAECTCQSLVVGRLSGRKLRANHVDWLLRLPRTNKGITPEEFRSDLAVTSTWTDEFSPAEFLRLQRLIDTFQFDTPIPAVLVHGDFAPWNLKRQHNGEIAAFDWEDARIKGLPLHDLSHFFLIQGCLFGIKYPYEAMRGNLLVRNYLSAFGLDLALLKPLFLHYLVTRISGQAGDCSDLYRSYLMRQLKLLVAQ
ncbi:MAG: phosphotransferase [Desulfuromonadaceae bacterium]